MYKDSLKRIAGAVDLLIGMDLEGLHPDGLAAQSGSHLRVKQYLFGLVLMGAHPELRMCGSMPSGLVGCHAVVRDKASIERIGVRCNLSRAVQKSVETFIQGEELGVEVQPKCGGCKCSNCPLVGHTFSFVEEQELRMIQENLRFDSEGGLWVTKYPWLVDPNTLPNNYKSALATLKHTEKTLSKDAVWSQVYDDQIKDMLHRDVAKILTAEEIAKWDGPVFYLSHLAVVNPKSTSTPVRIVFSVDNGESAMQLARDTNDVLNSAGFKIKHWILSGDNGVRVSVDDSPDTEDSGVYETKVLGVVWKPSTDVIAFHPSLNFSAKKRGVYLESDLEKHQVPDSIPMILTRRVVLEQVMKLYDPFGILSPFTLLAKILLRKTWTLNLGWDDALPDIMWDEWSRFFTQLFQCSELEFDRVLAPSNRVGKPTLVVMSDGSDLAYGCVAYIRWELNDGSFWSRLVLAKCRIAPLRKLSTPQMELNGAVLSKRCRKVVESELRVSFVDVYQFVDSATVLNMLNKVSTRFKIYEGVRIGEIQQATGDMSDWHWICGSSNTSDGTRQRVVVWPVIHAVTSG